MLWSPTTKLDFLLLSVVSLLFDRTRSCDGPSLCAHRLVVGDFSAAAAFAYRFSEFFFWNRVPACLLEKIDRKDHLPRGVFLFTMFPHQEPSNLEYEDMSTPFEQFGFPLTFLDEGT